METENQEVADVVEEQPLVVGSPSDISIGEPEAEVVEEVAAAPAENIKIGDKSFATQQEAWDYADKLAQERLAQDAYRQGLDDAARMQGQVTQETVAPPQESFDDKFYSDPEAYLRERDNMVRQSVKDEILGELSTKEREKQLWKQFYNENPDLQVKDKLVKVILNENWDVLGKMQNSDEALKILASKTRAELKKYMESNLPSTELPRTATQVSAGKGGQVTPPPTQDKPLDFLSQINQHQKGRLI